MNEQELERWRESLKEGDVVYFNDRYSAVQVAVIARTWGQGFKINRPWSGLNASQEIFNGCLYPTAADAQVVYHAEVDRQIAYLEKQKSRPLPEVTDELIERLRAYKGRGK